MLLALTHIRFIQLNISAEEKSVTIEEKKCVL